jgi:hypothetical protein
VTEWSWACGMLREGDGNCMCLPGVLSVLSAALQGNGATNRHSDGSAGGDMLRCVEVGFGPASCNLNVACCDCRPATLGRQHGCVQCCLPGSRVTRRQGHIPACAGRCGVVWCNGSLSNPDSGLSRPPKCWLWEAVRLLGVWSLYTVSEAGVALGACIHLRCDSIVVVVVATMDQLVL